MWAYFDTSALVKRYVDEAGRREVLQLLRKHECVASAVLPVELRSALRCRVDEGTLEPARLPEILKRVSADRGYWTLSGVSESDLMFVSADMRQTEAAVAVGLATRYIA
jgi:hypothetical protein